MGTSINDIIQNVILSNMIDPSLSLDFSQKSLQYPMDIYIGKLLVLLAFSQYVCHFIKMAIHLEINRCRWGTGIQ